MAITKTVTQIITNTSMAASTYFDSTTLLDLNDCIALAFEVDFSSSSSAEKGVRADILVSYDSTEFDTQVYDQFTLTFTSGTTARYAQSFPVTPSPRYMKLRVTNLSTGSIASACNVWSHVQTA